MESWKQYLLNYPDLQEAGLKTETQALQHYQRFGISENRTDELTIIPLTIITPCIRQENLDLLKDSINFDRVCEWIIVYDFPFEKKYFSELKITEYHHSDPLSKYGNAQRNYAISKIKNETSYIYFLDDDNLMHQDIFKLSLIPNKIYSFNQQNGLSGKHLLINNIDTGMVLMYYPLIKDIKWKLENYESDGLYIQNCFLQNKNSRYYINKELCYYNKLIPTTTIFKGYQDLKNIEILQNVIPKIIFKSSWYTRNSMDPKIKTVLQKTIHMNPGYTLYYFDDREMEQFIGDYDPTFRCLKAFKKLIPGAFKSDFWRYCLLEKYGGCYSDIGHQMKCTYNSILSSQSLILVEEIKNLGIHNGFICCTPGCKLMKMAIDQCLYNIENGLYLDTDISITGPSMLGKVYREMYLETIDERKQLSVKMLKHVILNSQKYIYDNNNELIVTKFDNYDSIMYPPGRLDYHNLWKLKNVYKS